MVSTPDKPILGRLGKRGDLIIHVELEVDTEGGMETVTYARN